MTTRLAIAFVALAVLTTGCQTPGGLFRSPEPSAHDSGALGRQAATHGAAFKDDLPAAQALPASPIAQVGFVDRLSGGCASGCGTCTSCITLRDACAASGGACQACPPMMPSFMPPMGRPVDPQEYLCNGEDQSPLAHVNKDDYVAGVEPQDTIVHYTTMDGDIHVQESNRTCLYSPRFGAIRQVSEAVAGEKAIGLAKTYLPTGPTGIGLSEPSLVVNDVHELARADVARRVDAMRDRNRGVPVESIVQPTLAEDALQILATLEAQSLSSVGEAQMAILQQGALAAQEWMVRDAVEVMIESMEPPVLTRDARVEAIVEYDFPDAGRLEIIKVADRSHAAQGEKVTFAIKVRNVGDSEVSHVEIKDSLIARLQYVDGSQTCDREADFGVTDNDAGSVKLSWTFKDDLAVGETATIEFQCLVR